MGASRLVRNEDLVDPRGVAAGVGRDDGEVGSLPGNGEKKRES